MRKAQGRRGIGRDWGGGERGPWFGEVLLVPPALPF